MKSIIPYLNFNGDTEEAFNFYRSVLGGEFTPIMRFKDMPPGSPPVPEKEKDKVMHMGLLLGKAGMLLSSDVWESMGQKAVFGTNFYIMIEPESEEEAQRIFAGLSAGGKIEMPLGKQFWGDLFGTFTDKFGVMWMIDYGYPKQP